MNVTVIENQNLFDIAIQEDGSVLTALDWAIENSISDVTSLLYPGQILERPNSDFRDSDVANYFRDNSKMIATSTEIEKPKSKKYGFPYGFPIRL